jgi:hypothetical protein
MNRKETGNDAADEISMALLLVTSKCGKTKSAQSWTSPIFVSRVLIHMAHMLHQSNLPTALPYPIEDQHEGWKAIKPGSFVILSIDYELSMKNLFNPDVDEVMSSMPNKKI